MRIAAALCKIIFRKWRQSHTFETSDAYRCRGVRIHFLEMTTVTHFLRFSSLRNGSPLPKRRKLTQIDFVKRDLLVSGRPARSQNLWIGSLGHGSHMQHIVHTGAICNTSCINCALRSRKKTLDQFIIHFHIYYSLSTWAKLTWPPEWVENNTFLNSFRWSDCRNLERIHLLFTSTFIIHCQHGYPA